ncbi:MAG: RNA polymerase sigma factor RpoD, partial [Desulfitobacterium sp.]|nr:RNA polymerase sigma factor RpoD [Desulfitobacterium sp.]
MAKSRVMSTKEKEPNKGGESMSEEMKIKAVKELIENAKSKGSITYREIMDALQGIELTADQMDEVYEQLSTMGIELISDEEEAEGEDLEKVPEPIEKDEEDGETEEVDVDLSVPEGVGIDDPV